MFGCSGICLCVSFYGYLDVVLCCMDCHACVGIYVVICIFALFAVEIRLPAGGVNITCLGSSSFYTQTAYR